jgi:UDP-glucose 4-epimerase
MPKYLVTGAAGFLGYHLACALSAERDAHVVCVDSFVRGERDAYYAELCQRSNVTGLELDLCDRDAVFSLPDDFDVVFHLAALNGTQNFYERPLEVLQCCTLPTFWLWERLGPSPLLKRFVYAGTSESYASTVTRFAWEVPTGEEVPLSIDDVSNPRWSYAASKIHGEVLTAQAGRHYGKGFTIIRYHNAYGPRMGDRHVVPDFLMRAKHGEFVLYGYEDTRSFLYVTDAVDATIGLSKAEGADGQVVNVGSDQEISIQRLAGLMMEVCGFTGEITRHSSPRGSVRRRVPRIGKLQSLTGFAPKVGLRDGLKLTADYYLADRRDDQATD